MSKQYPECPMYSHNNCKELHNPNSVLLYVKIKNVLRNYISRQRKLKNNP